MLRLRRATAIDSSTLWRWRNEPLTRSMSRSSAEISWIEHQRWYQQLLDDPRRVVLIAQKQSEGGSWCDVGCVRFEPLARGAQLSIMVAACFQGRGIGRELLCEAVRWAFEGGQLGFLEAFIQPFNEPSVKLFEGAGFCQVGQEQEGLRRYRLELKAPRTYDS